MDESRYHYVMLYHVWDIIDIIDEMLYHVWEIIDIIDEMLYHVWEIIDNLERMVLREGKAQK